MLSAIAIGLFLVSVRSALAQNMSEGIAAPKSLTASLSSSFVCPAEGSATCQQRLANGGLGLVFTWGVYCPQSLCLFPKTVQIERNGAVAAPIAVTVVPSGGTSPFAVIVNKDGWAKGDCFRFDWSRRPGMTSPDILTIRRLAKQRARRSSS